MSDRVAPKVSEEVQPCGTYEWRVNDQKRYTILRYSVKTIDTGLLRVYWWHSQSVRCEVTRAERCKDEVHGMRAVEGFCRQYRFQ